jgi:hypothetical protein
MKGQGVAESAEGRWTRAEDYVGALSYGRNARRRRADAHRLRTEPEAPRLLLSTVPFLALISVMGILSVAIMVAAIPGSEPAAAPRAPPPRELGVAQKGWLQEAQKDFHS